MKFTSPVGVTAKERKKGNTLEISLGVQSKINKSGKSDDIAQTVDYKQLYDLVSEIVGKESNLLEKISCEITDKVFETFPKVKKINLSVSKLNPPIGGECERATIKTTSKRKKG